MSILRKIFVYCCVAFVLGVVTPAPSFGVDWNPALIDRLTIDSRGVMRYSGQGGGIIKLDTVPDEWKKGGAKYNAKFGNGATPAATSTSSTAAKATTAAAKAPKPLPTGTITSSKGNVFTRELFTHTDGQQYYREVHKNGIVNYKDMRGKFVTGKGFNNMPPPKPGPIKDGGFKGKMKMIGSKAKSWGGKALGVAGKAMGVLGIVSGTMMIWEANAGEGARTGGDLLKAAAGGAMVGMGVASIVPGVGTLIGTAVGAVAGAATVGWQMFSETDCLTDPVTNKQTCCNTTTGDVKRGIGDYMFCQKKSGGAMAMVRQCKVGGRSESSCGWDNPWGCVKDAFSDDAWDEDCETRWCSGTSAPPNGLADLVVYEPDTSKVCWKWRCGDGLKQEGKKCVPNYCDGHGPNEEEKDLPIYQFAIDEENKCIIWDCIDGYQLMADYCAEIIPETTPAPTEQQTTPQPEPAPQEPAPLEPDLGPDMYEYAIAKIEAQLAEMDAECGVGGKGNNEDTEIEEAIRGSQNLKEASKKLGTVKKFAERAGAAVGKSAAAVDAADDAAKNSKQFDIKKWTEKLFKTSDPNDKTDSNPNNNSNGAAAGTTKGANTTK